MRAFVRALAVGLTLFGALPVAATELRLNFGAGLWGSADYYWSRSDHTRYWGVLDATVSVGAQVNRQVELGGRAGLLLVPAPMVVGVPADFYVRILPARNFYLEGTVGPWLMLAEHPFRFHGGFGLGWAGDAVQIGIEGGYFAPAPYLKVQFGIPLN